MMSSVKRWNIFCPRVISSRCFAAARGRAKVIRCAKSRPDSTRPVIAVKVVAPQHQQVHDLVGDGFYSAQTVSAFLSRGSMPRGAVVIVDEAGQIGGEQMERLLSFVKEHDGRLDSVRGHAPAWSGGSVRRAAGD